MRDDAQRWYVPAEFDLYEYDDAYVESGGRPGRDDGRGRRWFLVHHGSLGRLADEVHLTWSNGAAIATSWVARRQGDAPQVQARITAAMAALDGPLAWFMQQGPPGASSAAVCAHADALEAWSPAELTIDGVAHRGYGTDIEGVRVAYAVLDDLVVGLACHGGPDTRVASIGVAGTGDAGTGDAGTGDAGTCGAGTGGAGTGGAGTDPQNRDTEDLDPWEAAAQTGRAAPPTAGPLALRTLADCTAYSLDPRRPHSTADNAAEWARVRRAHGIQDFEPR
jgi:hypothetical protein